MVNCTVLNFLYAKFSLTEDPEDHQIVSLFLIW